MIDKRAHPIERDCSLESGCFLFKALNVLAIIWNYVSVFKALLLTNNNREQVKNYVKFNLNGSFVNFSFTVKMMTIN